MNDLKGVEALRGLTAIGIAAYSWLWATGMAVSRPVANLCLLYDLFFVLSGFVIAQVYRARLTSAREVSRFVMLRFGRVYPLHAAVLMLLLALQTAGLPAGPEGRPGTLVEFMANLAMLQGLGVIEPGSWNAPAWFISVEFALSVLFAALCLADIPRSAVGLGALLLSALWALWLLSARGGAEPGDAGGQLLRGFAGFMLGVLAQAARRTDWARRWQGDQTAFGATLWEAAALGGFAGLIALAPPSAQFAAPVLAAALVWVCATARGALRLLLGLRRAHALARISFGVFLCHWAAVGLMRGLTARVDSLESAEAAAILTPLYLTLVIALAAAAERWVERPTRDAMRAWIDRRSRGHAAGARRGSNVV